MTTSPKHRFAPAHAVFSAIGSVTLMALLAGCGVAHEEATSAPASSDAKPSKTPMADLSDTRSPMNGNGEVAADPTSTATTNGQEIDGETTLPGIDDTCAGVCDEHDRLRVEHPQHGPLEIVLYHNVTSGDAVPSTGTVSYAVYQNGTAVGLASGDGESGVPGFTPNSPNFEVTNHFAEHTDKYGNVYFYTYGSGITVLTPTDKGYDSHGTLPGASNPFDRATQLTVDENGEPTIETPVLDSEGNETGETETYTFNGTQFVKA